MGRVTIAGLAERLGISKASVSYALNGQPGVSEQTRERVLNLASELGWYPSSSARALSRSRVGIVGIVLSREPEMIGSEPYYMRLIAGIESVLIDADMSLLLRVSGPERGRDLEVYRRWAGERRVDGVIVFDIDERDPRPELLRELGLPFVLHGSSGEDSGYAATMADQAAEARTIVEHLRALGHRRIGHVTGPLHLVHERARSSAVRALAEAAGMRVAPVESDYTLDGGRVATAALLAAGERPTAVIYDNDLLAQGGLAALRAAHVNVPRSVSVVSWDDSILCSVSTPAVTALHRDPFEQGRQSAALLLEMIDGVPAHTVAAGPSALIVRNSTAAPLAN